MNLICGVCGEETDKHYLDDNKVRYCKHCGQPHDAVTLENMLESRPADMEEWVHPKARIKEFKHSVVG